MVVPIRRFAAGPDATSRLPAPAGTRARQSLRLALPVFASALAMACGGASESSPPQPTQAEASVDPADAAGADAQSEAPDIGPPDASPDQLISDAPAVDLETDPLNCGWVGHDCRGAACADGMCSDLLVSPACLDGDFVDNVSPVHPCGPNGGVGIAIQQSDVVWLLGMEGMGAGNMYRAGVTGAQLPTRLAAGLWFPQGAVAVGTDVLFATHDQGTTLWKLTASSTIEPYREVESPKWPQTSNGTLFWVGRERQIWSLALAGGDAFLVHDVDPLVTPAGNYAVRDFAVSGDSVYFADCGDPTACAIKRVSTQGGPPTVLAQGQRYVGCLSVTSSRVMWSLAPSESQGRVELRAVSTGGGPITTVGERPESVIPLQVLAQGDDVFFLDNTGVYRVDAEATSSSAVPVAAPIGGFASPACHQMTADADYLYYVTARGEVRRVAK